MRHIYANAAHVLVWLDPINKDGVIASNLSKIITLSFTKGLCKSGRNRKKSGSNMKKGRRKRTKTGGSNGQKSGNNKQRNGSNSERSGSNGERFFTLLGRKNLP